ncbi:hypothetical protein ACFVH6_21840 [Spirillospora sp. NPDC127200]
MTRYLYGGTADYVIGAGTDVGEGPPAVLKPGAVLRTYSALTGGIEYTDLRDLSDQPIASGGLVADAYGGMPMTYGPDGVTTMYLSADGGPRRAISPVDLGAAVTALAADVTAAAAGVAALNGTVSGLATVASTGQYADLVGEPVLADVATSGDYADLANAPGPGLQYVVKTAGNWPVRAASAPDASRPAMWIGAAPAPSAGAGYALPGDLWAPVP